MRISSLDPTPTFALDRSTDAPKTEKKADPTAASGTPAIDPEKLRLAREFEQIFIRKMLSSLEKSGQGEASGSPRAGGSAYGSMVVSALAEAVSKGGGVGLAEVIAKAASQPLARVPSTSTGATAAIQSAIADATAGAASEHSLPPGAARITVPENVRITVSGPPTAITYPRPAPIRIINNNNDIHDSFKDPKR